MRFRLVYEGRLGGQKTWDVKKHEMRKQFHPQLEALWKQLPLSDMASMLKRPLEEGEIDIFEQRSGITFCPLVTDKLYLVARLNFLLLRREEPGKLFSRGGDVDNRIKTLIDALRMPSDDEIRRAGISPNEEPFPFHCLLKDDTLVTSFSVDTDRLLTVGHADHVQVIIAVETRATRAIWRNTGLSG